MIITQNDCIYTDSSPSEWSQKFILLRKISFSHAKTFSSFRSNSSAFESRFGMLFHILLYVFQCKTFTCAISPVETQRILRLKQINYRLMSHFLSFSPKQSNSKGVVRCNSKLFHRCDSFFFWGHKTIISFQKYNMRGFCCTDHTQGYGRVTLMVTGCLSSETAVSLLKETSDNGCPNRTALSNNSAITCLRLKCKHTKESWKWTDGLKLHITSNNCFCNQQL